MHFTISYPHTGMGIVAGIIFFCGYGYGIELPGGYIPVAIPKWNVPEGRWMIPSSAKKKRMIPR